MNRREFLKIIGASSAAIATTGYGEGFAGECRRPNIIFIMSDDHAAQAISCYGSRMNKTPNIDRIAKTSERA